MALQSPLSFTESLTSARRIAFYEGHKRIAIVMILIVFLLPFVGVFLQGLIGAVSGVIISVVCYFLTPYLVLKLGGQAPQ
ncbi:MAG: hypothetical protein R3B37_05350 [Nitrospira sp.]|nr:hypothetical protein [Nitrospira sp.]